MSESTFRKYYPQAAFVAMGGVTAEAAQFQTHLSTVGFTVPLVTAHDDNGFITVEFSSLPSPNDITTLDNAVATFVALPATDAPLVAESLAVTSATNATLVTVIDQTTPPRAAGTYQISWTALVGMLAAVTNTGVRGVITLTRTQGANVVARTWEHNSSLQQPQTFCGCVTFLCQAGATLRAHLQVAKVGAPAATAQMSVARITADKIG
jgi:hypothetical protein